MSVKSVITLSEDDNVNVTPRGLRIEEGPYNTVVIEFTSNNFKQIIRGLKEMGFIKEV